MQIEKAAAKKAKQHTVYKNAAGKRVPGTTTITGVMDKSGALVPWANKLGLQGYNVREYVDELATIGTLAHEIIEEHCGGKKVDYDDYTKKQRDCAENAVVKFFNWEEQQKSFKVLGIEKVLVSEQYQFGGTCDLYCDLNGKKTLIDLKTCKAVYGTTDEKWMQVRAYKQLLIENGFPVDDVRIVRVGRDESEGFEDLQIPNPNDIQWKRFVCCRNLYALNAELRRFK